HQAPLDEAHALEDADAPFLKEEGLLGRIPFAKERLAGVERSPEARDQARPLGVRLPGVVRGRRCVFALLIVHAVRGKDTRPWPIWPSLRRRGSSRARWGARDRSRGRR